MCFQAPVCPSIPFQAAIYGVPLEFAGSFQWTGADSCSISTIYRYSPIFIIHLGNSCHVLMQLCHILSRSQHGLKEFNFVFLQDFIFNHCIGTNFGLVNVVVPFEIVRKMNQRLFLLISRNVYEPFKVKRNFTFFMRMSRHCFQWVELQCSYHNADHFWSNSKSLFMTALALSSSDKSRMSFI